MKILNLYTSKIVLLFIFVLTPTINMIGKTISYSYDESGNRIKRGIRLVPQYAPGHSDVESISTDEIFGHKRIKVLPDQVTQTIKIEISEYQETDRGGVTLYDMSGDQLIYVFIKSYETILDIKSTPTGIYILNVELNGNSTSWKVYNH